MVDCMQVSYVDGGRKKRALKPPVTLDVDKFTHTFKDPERALKLVTLAPLYPVLNSSKPDSKPKSKNDSKPKSKNNSKPKSKKKY